jgi:hypothetical protein
LETLEEIEKMLVKNLDLDELTEEVIQDEYDKIKDLRGVIELKMDAD